MLGKVRKMDKVVNKMFFTQRSVCIYINNIEKNKILRIVVALILFIFLTQT